MKTRQERVIVVGVLAALVVMLSFATGADVFRSRSAGFDYMNAFTVAPGGQHTGGNIRFLAIGGDLTTEYDSARTVNWLSIHNSSTGTVNVRVYGPHGTSDPAAVDTSNYTLVQVPKTSSVELANMKITGVYQPTNPGATVFYIGR